MVVPDGDIRGVENQHTFIQCVLHSEASDDHVLKARIVKTVDQDAIGLARRVNDRIESSRADQRQRFANDNSFFIGAERNIDDVIVGSSVHG